MTNPAENDAACVCPNDRCVGIPGESLMCLECLALGPDDPCLRDVGRPTTSPSTSALALAWGEGYAASAYDEADQGWPAGYRTPNPYAQPQIEEPVSETPDQYAAREASRYAVQQAQAVDRIRDALTAAPTDESLGGLIDLLDSELELTTDPSALAIVIRDWGLSILRSAGRDAQSGQLSPDPRNAIFGPMP